MEFADRLRTPRGRPIDRQSSVYCRRKFARRIRDERIMEFLLERRNLVRLIKGLLSVVVLVVAYFQFSQMLSHLQSQDDLMVSVQDLLDGSIAEISVAPVVPGRAAEPCYATRSQEEIARIVRAMRGVTAQLTQGTTRREPFVLSLTFRDGGRADFMLYRRKDNLSRAHLDKLEYMPAPDGERRLVGDAGLVFPDIGEWAAEAIRRNNCREARARPNSSSET